MKYNTQHIDKYLNGELPELEVKAFEQEMQSDKDLAHEVKLQGVAVETVQYANFMDKIGNVRAEIAKEKVSVITESPTQDTPVIPIHSERPGIIHKLLPIIGLAAAALIALLIWQPWQSNLYQPYVLNTTKMSSGEQTLQQAQDAYNSGDYAAALPILEKYPDKVEVQLAKGNAEYNLGKFDAAATTFKRIISGNKYPYHTPTANWYLALTYLKQDKGEEAKAALREIEDGEYYEKAQKLLKKIR